MIYCIDIRETPLSCDAKDVWWYIPFNEDWVGSGHQDKKTGIILVRNCPKCRQENYALNESTGTCYACGFNPNWKGGEK